MTTVEHQRQREAIQAFLTAQDWTWAVTAVFNRETSFAGGKRALEAFHARIDRAFLGRNWQRAPAERRSFAIWFPEHPQSNLHFHGLIRVPTESAKRFLTVGPAAWAKLNPAGNLDAKPITDLSGWGGYVTKENALNFVISDEFHG